MDCLHLGGRAAKIHDARAMEGVPRSRHSLAEALERRVVLAAVVYSAAGTDFLFENLVSSVAHFREALAPATPLDTAGPAFVDGKREVGWDQTPDRLQPVPSDLPGDFYKGNGLSLSTPGTGLRVSEPGPSGPLYFESINPEYRRTFFRSFSGYQLFSPLGSTVTDVTFSVPAADVPATVSAFGVVFIDVDDPNDTTLEFFDSAGSSLGVFAAPPQDGGWSFLGVRFDAGERAARVRITSGNTPLGPSDGDATDVVAMDNFIYAEPQPSAPNVYRFDGGGGDRLWSNPLNWQPDVVPPRGAVIELPGGVSTYDLPAGTEYDRLLITGSHRVVGAAGAAATLALRKGIRNTGSRSFLDNGLIVELTAPQSFDNQARHYFGRSGQFLSIQGTIRLNGHDLTLDGPGDFFLDADASPVLIDASLGGRLVRNGTGYVTLSVGGASAADRFPREFVINGGETHFSTGRPGVPTTSVRLSGGTFYPGRSSTTGPFSATGGTLATRYERYTVSGDFSMTAAATLQPSLALESGLRLASVVVNGSVSLGGAALRIETRPPLLPPNLLPPLGVPFPIIENDGADPVTGTFGGTPEGGVIASEGHLYRVTYRGGDGNDVVVTRVGAATFEFRPPRQVRVQFTDGAVPAGLSREDLSLRNVTTGAPVDVSQSDFTYDPGTGVATWTFRSPLPDGNYAGTLATIQPARYTFEFFALAGDLTQDRRVNGIDFAVLAGNFGKSGMTYEQGDVNGDGTVNGADFALLAANFGKTLLPPAPNVVTAARAATPAVASPTHVRVAPAPTKPRRVVRQSARPAAAGSSLMPATKIARHARLKERGG